MKGITTDQGRQTLEKFKIEAANEVGVNLKNGYNGDLTSREAGSVGGQMVKKICPIRTTERTYSRNLVNDKLKTVTYIAQIYIDM